MRVVFVLAALLILPIALASAPLEEDAVVPGPNHPGANHQERWRFLVAGGESVEATLTWPDELGTLTLWIRHEPDSQVGCNLLGEGPDCFVGLATDAVDPCSDAWAGDAVTSTSPLHAELVADGRGAIFVDVNGMLSTGPIPIHVTISVDDGAPPAHTRHHRNVTSTTQGIESSVCGST